MDEIIPDGVKVYLEIYVDCVVVANSGRNEN
jgi:hypothetical protein